MPSDESNLTNQFTGMPIKHLLGAPLKAASEANGLLARSQLQFLLSACFEKVQGSTSLKPKMIEMHIERDIVLPDGSKSEEKASMTIAVPLLTLIPINSLSVDDIQVSFDMEIQSANEDRIQNKKNKKNGRNNKEDKSNKDDLEMYGSLAPKGHPSGESDSSRSHSANAHYEVKMHAGNLPLPTGLTTVIDLLNKNIAPIPAKNKSIEGY